MPRSPGWWHREHGTPGGTQRRRARPRSPRRLRGADGAAGTAAGLPPGTAAARGAPRRQRRRGAARPAAPAPQPLPAAAAPRWPPLAAPPAQAAPLRRGVHRLCLRMRRHLAVRVAQVAGPDLSGGGAGGLAGQDTAAEEGRLQEAGIIAANVFVFCLWRLPGMRRIMFTYFTSDPSSRALCSPMLLSTFSHFSLFHMAANMYVLWSFSSSIVSLLGCEQFIAVYLSAGVISTFVSYVAKMATGRFEPSLGASGAIMTVLAAVCAKMPEAKLAIIFLPMFTFTAGNALKAIIAFDTAGLALGWRLFDHAAHLGGALFGIWYVTYGHELIWKNREPLVKAWHEMRTKNAGKGGGGRSN
ncbi:presenilins-associated rhomboid-like protein, mitochondrial isoform X5 [Falco peregrinus]|uniref:presenilins-associated rhomboid-like protein, mitochondrial isoform X5 n=1 Tax=Falco peregrinus TaxID=8954 RepID=UPI0024783609|nr:presenilins-associated rhomboid-like protein, mitochondrial isoform X5 [Falco peregrinus]